jgi:hypothetical protein
MLIVKMLRHPGEGRDPVSTANQLEQIVPVRVHFLNDAHFPGAPPFLHLLFSNDGLLDFIKRLKPDEQLAVVSLRKAFNNSFPMFPYPPGQIAGNTDIQGSVPAARHDVDEAALAHGSPHLPFRRRPQSR